MADSNQDQGKTKTEIEEEIKAILRQILSLPFQAQCQVFEGLRDELAAVTSPENSDARKIRERKEAIEAIRAVADHLGLAAREAPSIEQFNTAAKELDLGWRSNKVYEVWDSWKQATSIYLGPTLATQAVTRKGSRTRTNEQVLGDVRVWLRTRPEDRSMRAYDRFVREHNSKLPLKETPLMSGPSMARRFAVHWPRVIRAAEDKITLYQAAEEEIAEQIGGKPDSALVGVALIARLLRRSNQTIKKASANDPAFPTPVAHIRGKRAWLLADIRLYKRGLDPSEREEDECQANYMDSEELAGLLGAKHKPLRELIKEKRWDRVPRPEGSISSGYHYWKREKVKTSQTKTKPTAEATRKQEEREGKQHRRPTKQAKEAIA